MTVIGDVIEIDPALPNAVATFSIGFYPELAILKEPKANVLGTALFRIDLQMFYSQLADILSALDTALIQQKAGCRVSYSPTHCEFDVSVPPL